VAFNGHTIQLWHTKQVPTPPSGISAQAPQHLEKFVLDFSPDGMLAVVAMQGDNVVKVLDLKPGVLNLTINASMKVYGLRVIGDTVVVMGNWEAQRFYLPTRDCVSNSRAGLEDSAWTVCSNFYPNIHVEQASISHDYDKIVFFGGNHMHICHGPNWGDEITRWFPGQDVRAWFADGFTIWCADEFTIWCADDRGVAEKLSRFSPFSLIFF